MRCKLCLVQRCAVSCARWRRNSLFSLMARWLLSAATPPFIREGGLSGLFRLNAKETNMKTRIATLSALLLALNACSGNESDPPESIVEAAEKWVVELNSYSYEMEGVVTGGHSVAAQFLPKQASLPRGNETKYGDCVVSRYPETQGEPTVGTPEESPLEIRPGAGELRITGLPISPIVVAAAEFPGTVRREGFAFRGGETLTYSATGDARAVPSFSTTLLAPSAVAISEIGGWRQGDAILNLPRNSDAVVKWTAATPSNIRMFAQTEAAIMVCVFRGNALSGTIPQAALEQLGNGGGYSSMSVLIESRTSLKAGKYIVEVAAQLPAKLGDSAPTGVLGISLQ